MTRKRNEEEKLVVKFYRDALGWNGMYINDNCPISLVTSASQIQNLEIEISSSRSYFQSLLCY